MRKCYFTRELLINVFDGAGGGRANQMLMKRYEAFETVICT